MPRKIGFRVIHVSGQDENFKAVELNTHHPTTKGWQSSRFCLYPQDIVIQLETRTRLRKIQILSHQFLIATKIEFYVGDVPDGIPVSLQNARYTRLGYVALSDNEKTGYKARELKSVHVDANGVFVKFVIHKNHVNKHNLYNQVGIVALNVIGEEVDKSKEKNIPYVSDGLESDDLSLRAIHNRPDYISPLDDLAFDMYQDPEVAQIIRRLEHKKQEAVLQERYDYAKKLKNAIQDLQKVGEKLGKYEVEKRQAVENEDYDKAKLKKVQMDEYRLQVYKQLELYELLEVTGPRHPQPIDLDPVRDPTPPRLTQITPQPEPTRMHTPPPRTPYDDRPLPAIKKKHSVQSEADEQLPVKPPTPRDERPLPTARTMNPPIDDEDVIDAPSGTVTGEPEPMTEKDQREAGIVIDTFGMPVASKAYSKTWSFREDAMLEVYKTMMDMSPSESRDEAKNSIKAALFLISRALKDKVHAVYTAGLNLLKMILSDFCPKHKIPKSELTYAIEKTLPLLIQRTGDTAPRCRDAAKNFILECSKFPEVKSLQIIPHECVKPFKLSISPRLALSRTEIVDMLYKEHGLTNSGLSVENIMKFCCQAIQHTAGEVRDKAERLIIDLYKEVREPVKAHLPPDDERTRKNVLYKQLFEAFDRIDGKPSKDELRKQKAESEQAKQEEIKALQNQLQQLKDMASGKAPVDEKAIKDDKKEKKEKKNKGKSKPENKSQAAMAEDGGDDMSIFQIDHTCIFCGEKNEQFTDEGLDLHYWKSCPMLKRCPQCKQVVEIAGLTDHLLTECDHKDKFKKCPRCKEAIIDVEFEQHIAEKTCLPAEAGKNHCPLCHINIPPGEDAWKEHLMGEKGCKANPRRLPALNKLSKGGSKAKGAKSQTKGAVNRTPRK